MYGYCDIFCIYRFSFYIFGRFWFWPVPVLAGSGWNRFWPVPVHTGSGFRFPVGFSSFLQIWDYFRSFLVDALIIFPN